MASSDKIDFDCHLALRAELIKKMKEENANKSSMGELIESWRRQGSAHQREESLDFHFENIQWKGIGSSITALGQN